MLTMKEIFNPPRAFTPKHFVRKLYEEHIPNYAHFASPMVHPTTGKTITSYKQLMHDPQTANIWQMMLGKDFGGITQGDDKTGQKGTNSVFVMKHEEIDVAMKAGHKWTYARIVIDHQQQKANPNWIRIAVGGNLITYKGNTYTCTADLTTSKLLWNSVLSTNRARYMCIDVMNFYLTAALDYYK